jgi:signal transduction histidine kinase
MDDAALTRLVAVGRGLLTELELDAVLGRVLETARELTAARYAAVGVLDEDRAGLARFVTSGIPAAEREAIGDLPRGHGVLGVLITDPRPLRLDDVGAHPRSYGFPVNHPPMQGFLGVPIVIRGEAWGNLYLADKEGGGAFTEADEEAMVVLADWTAIAVENARLYESATRRRDELARTVRALETTTEIAGAISGEIELDRILELLVKRGRALVSARTLIIALVTGDQIEVAAAAGVVPPDLRGRFMALDESGLAAVLRGRRPERLSDVNRRGLLAAVGADAPTGLIVPLVHRGRAIGVLAAFDPLEAEDFSADDERLLQAFAASAATAVATGQNVQSIALERSIRAAEAERSRWARELHDETLQELGALRIMLAGARRSGDPERIDGVLADAMELVTGGIANLRALITDLRPAALDEIGTEAAVSALAERVRASTGLEIELDMGLDYEAGRATERHVPELEEAVYRTIQEALNNVVKHAAAHTVAVRLADAGHGVEVEVRDDGRGFDPSVASTGFGLLGMTERVALLDGRLEVRSAPGEGTTVAVWLPVRRRRPRSEQAPGAGHAAGA